MLFPLVTLLCTLTIVLASSLDSLASLPSPPTLSSASSALDTSITHSKANHVDRDTMYSFSDQNNEKRFEKRLKKRCFYIGTFFQKYVNLSLSPSHFELGEEIRY
ncbi:hypothetical protein JCM5353_000383 [Sporobolomyces roseus]